MDGELGQLLKNYRLRRKLGLLRESSAPVDAEDARWVRQAWRPRSLAAAAGGAAPGTGGDDGTGVAGHLAPAAASAAAPAAQSAELLTQISGLQQRVEQGYRELNAERRAQGALEAGLRRQGESIAAIVAECESLRGQLERVQREVQERVAENGRLAAQLGSKRRSLASSLSQAAVLASAVSKIGPTCLGGVSDGALGGPVVVGSSACDELVSCRMQIAALLEENGMLARAIARAEAA